MDDSQCLLLDFINEDNKVAVGFRNWIVPAITDDDDLQHTIEEGQIITIKWPDCNVEPAVKMVKREKSCKWQYSVAKILAAGSKYMLIDKILTIIINNMNYNDLYGNNFQGKNACFYNFFILKMYIYIYIY